MKIFKNITFYIGAAAALLIGTAIIVFYNQSGKKFFFGSNNKDEAILEESVSMGKSASAYWWLNSGGIMKISGQGFSTNIGPLPENSSWRKLYAKTNSTDTDNGYYPQNIFRLVTRQKWQNFSQSVYFNIDANNLTQSKNRNESNGVLLFNRYQDGDNLYYSGLRVDGRAVIKKKIGGKYYTMAEKNIWADGKKYDRKDNPNFLPFQQWIGIKSEVQNTDDATVVIKLYVDQEQKGDWRLVLEARDKNDKYGKKPFLDQGYAGIRTDFVDVYFKQYDIQELK